MSIRDAAWLNEKTREISENGEFALAIRYADFRCLIDAGERRYLLAVRDGEAELKLEPGPGDPWDFAVRGAADAWDKFIGGKAGLEYRDPLAMAFQGTHSRTGEVKNHLLYEGNYKKLFANLHPLYVFLSELQAHFGRRAGQ